MVKKCCVPACGGNYDKDRKVTVFSFPMHDLRRVEQWKRKIPRQWNFEVTKETVVCERHFSDHQILRTETFKRPDGSSVTVLGIGVNLQMMPALTYLQLLQVQVAVLLTFLSPIFIVQLHSKAPKTKKPTSGGI